MFEEGQGGQDGSMGRASWWKKVGAEGSALAGAQINEGRICPGIH